MLNCLSFLQRQDCGSAETVSEAPGAYGIRSCSHAARLLHMRPLQHWLHSRVPRWAWRRGALRVNITQECRRSFSPWTDLAFLGAGVPLEQVSRHVVVTTDASSTGWGATCNGHAASVLWTGPRLLWHINCLELLAVSGRPVCFPRVLPLPAVFLPDRGHPRHGRAGTQLASGSMQVYISPSEPARTDTVQSQGGRGAGPAGRAILAHPDLVSRTHSPHDSPSLAHSSEEGPPFSGARHHLAPASRPVEPPCVAPGWDAADLSGLPQAVVETITQARAPSTRQAYALKVESFRELVFFFSPRRPPKMHDWSSAFFPARKVGA